MDLYRSATLGHDSRARQRPYPYAEHRCAGRRRRQLPERLLPEHHLHAQPRQFPDRLLPQHHPCLRQRQRALGRSRAPGDEAAGRRGLCLRAVGQAASFRMLRPLGAPPRGRRLRGLSLGSQPPRPVAGRERLCRLGEGTRRDLGRYVRRKGLHAARTAPDHVLRRQGHRVHRGEVRPALADERQHLRSARTVRPAAGIPRPLSARGHARPAVPPGRSGNAGRPDRGRFPDTAAPARRLQGEREDRRLLRHDRTDRRQCRAHDGGAGTHRPDGKHPGRVSPAITAKSSAITACC